MFSGGHRKRPVAMKWIKNINPFFVFMLLIDLKLKEMLLVSLNVRAFWLNWEITKAISLWAWFGECHEFASSLVDNLNNEGDQSFTVLFPT